MSYERDFNQNHPEEKESIFEDLQILEEASKWTRFANYLIDSFAIQLIIYAIAFTCAFLGVEFLFDVHWFLDIILSLFFNFMYYYLFEHYTSGKTLGKFATGTKVVTLDNQIPDSDTLVKRSLCRLIPFDALSFLGEHSTGWHDSMSNTRVVKE